MLIHPIKMCNSDSEWVLVLNDDPAGPQKTCDLSGQRFVYLGNCLMLWFHHTDQCDKVSIIVREVYNRVIQSCHLLANYCGTYFPTYSIMKSRRSAISGIMNFVDDYSYCPTYRVTFCS